jgi:cob(I)alamin adenosyltransferase
LDERPTPKIYTRTGDAGATSLFDGTRVSKADARVEAYGDADELSSWLGLARVHLGHSPLGGIIDVLQRDLMAVASHLADPAHRIAQRVEKAFLQDADVARLEAWIDQLETRLTPLRRFILAGGSEPAALLHIARSVCRRAERRIVALGDGAVEPMVLTYVNRLSDLLFVMARTANAEAGVSEIEW